MAQLNVFYPALPEGFVTIPVDIENDMMFNVAAKITQELFKQHGEDLKVKDITLYKANLTLESVDDVQKRSLQLLHDATNESRMKPARSLDYYFPNMDAIPKRHIHILVFTSAVEELGDTLGGEIYLLRKKARQNARSSRPVFSPSETVKDPKKCAEVFGKTIHINRLPVALFSPILASLCKDLRNLDDIELPPAVVPSTWAYIKAASQMYDTEGKRLSTISPSITTTFGNPVFETAIPWADNVEPDAACTSSVGGIALPNILVELKNVVGLSGDPIRQAAVVYAKIVSSERAVDTCGDRTNFPMLLVGLAGERVQIAVAVSTGSIYVSDLITLELGLGLNTVSHVMKLARVFQCICKCKVRLEKHYTDLLSKPLPPTYCSMFPVPTPLNSSATLPSLTYHGFISNETGDIVTDVTQLNQGTTAKYYATLADDTKVVVKFAARYNAKAHKLLADAGFAPTLYFCEEVVGDVFMVVMEWVDAKPLKQDPLPIVLDRLAGAVKILHASNIVFGDLREQNILYDASSGRLALVDFDWADDHGKGRYPPHVNMSGQGLRWAYGVQPYEVMMKEHDLWQIQRMRGGEDE